MGLLKLYVDVQNNRLVVSSRIASPFVLPSFIQGDVIPIELYLVEPNISGGLSEQLSLLTEITYTVKLGIVTPSASSPVAHAVITLSADPSYSTNGKYTGSLALGSGITTLLGSATSVTSTFEVELTSATDIRTPIQIPCTVKAGGISSATPDTPAADTYPTANEVANTYVKKVGGAGEGFILKSPDGLHSVLIWVDNDGTLKTDPIT
jgi:hypothetical protein